MAAIPPVGLGGGSISSILSSPDFKVTNDLAAGGDQGQAAGAGAGGGAGSFGSMLADKIGALNDTLQQADTASQTLATGQAKDISSVVIQVEKASLDLQLASQIRNKAIEAYQDIFRMQI